MEIARGLAAGPIPTIDGGEAAGAARRVGDFGARGGEAAEAFERFLAAGGRSLEDYATFEALARVRLEAPARV